MRPHVSAETMARFQQGDLSQRRSSQISAHLAGCDRCSALGEDLGGVTTLLASANPPPMPEHLAARITSALAAEAASRSAVPEGSRIAAAEPRRPARSSRLPRLPRLPRIAPRVALGGLAAAAAMVLVAGGVYEIAVRGGSTAAPSASSSASAAARPAARSPGNGVMLPALPASGPALQYRHGGREDSITAVATGTDFTPADLASQVTAEVARYGAGLAKTGPNAKPSGQSGVSSPAAAPHEQSGTFQNIPVTALRGCVNRIAAGNLVLLVDVARYRGTPATVIVTEASQIGPMQIWVVGTGCTASRSDVLRHATATAPN